MTTRRWLNRQVGGSSMHRRFAQRAIQAGVPITEPDEPTIVQTIPIPIGDSVDSVRLYGWHDIYGTLRFMSADDLADFYSETGDPMRVETDSLYGNMISKPGSGTLGDIWYRPTNLPEGELNWNQPRNNTAVSVWTNGFEVLTESASMQLLTVRFNHGGDKGGGANYAELSIVPDPTTGSPNQNRLDANLRYVNYGVTQDTDTVKIYRNYPTYADNIAAYEIRFEIDGDNDNAVAKILRQGGSWQTLTVSSPPGTDYCDNSHWVIFNMWSDPDSVSGGITALSYFRIRKGDDESASRITYKVSRDGGSNWASVNGEAQSTSGYWYTDVDLSGQGAGSEVLIRVELTWPAYIRGIGLAWEA